RFSIPSSLLFLALTVLVLAAGVVLWHLEPAPGATMTLLPLLYLAGILPAFAILAFTARRLGLPSTRRHVWMSLLYGLTLAPLLALILELVALLALGQISGVGSAALGVPTNTPSNSLLLIVLLLTVSLVAPLVEEGVKPLGAVLLMRRLRTPASAFLLGMAAGVGFDIFETIGYIGQGQADWITIAIERVGAGLLHGVGAGMAALGWYYLINGKGVPYRWWRGAGCILYAIIQHAIFNGVFVVTLIPGLGNWLSQAWYIGRLPFQNADFLDFALYILIFALLYVVTGRLARGSRPPAAFIVSPEARITPEPSNDPGPAAVGSGAAR
ncbi:MAG: PrsW family glutamic-type intramembrane protease, partial [Ktedonobacterales bacterium]